jgi:hypothetical protein
MYQIAAMLDIFKGQLLLDDILEIELPLLSDLYNARTRFLEDKAKAEKREIQKAKSEGQRTGGKKKG